MITSNNMAKTTSPECNSYTHIAGYKFVKLEQLLELRNKLFDHCQNLSLVGTILLSQEGININLAGLLENTDKFKLYLDKYIHSVIFNQTQTPFLPYKKLAVKIKQEIITMRQTDIQPEKKPAPLVSPQELKQWLDEGRDITLLDTRNEYEVRFGTFKTAIHPNLENFSSFVNSVKNLDPEKPIVTFCTGGIRCEKAALLLISEGFKEVYQLQQGILNYFKEVGGAHYDGECFVFDQRISVDPSLKVTGTQQCKICQGPMKPDAHHICKNPG